MVIKGYETTGNPITFMTLPPADAACLLENENGWIITFYQAVHEYC